jgi:cytochrome o ubiquinol oxidase subunit I
VLWSIGFMVTFVIGGMTGVLQAVPPANFQLHNSVFLIAHFHNVIIGGVVFGSIAGYNYWFPKAFGFGLDERWGKASFWCRFVGFYLAFMPLYLLGLMGMTRRMQHYDNLAWQPWLLVAMVGAVVILGGILCQIIQLVVSIRARDKLRVTADPWNGRTLEWATASPPPAWNLLSRRTSAEPTLSGPASDGSRRSRTSQGQYVPTSPSKCRKTAPPALSAPSSPSSSASR